MRRALAHICRHLHRSSPPERGRMIERYIDSYRSSLRGAGEISLDYLEDIHRAASSSLHPAAAADDIMISAFLYAALRLPECLDRVSRVLIGSSEDVLRAYGCQDIGIWEPAPARARRRRSFFDGRETLAVCTSSVSDIDDLIPTLCAYQIEWNKMHKRLQGSTVGEYLKNGCVPYSKAGDALKTVLRISPADYEMLADFWGDSWGRTIVAIVSAPKNFRVRMYSSDEGTYKREVENWWHDLLAHFHDVGIENRPLYLVSSNTHSLANVISGFAYRYRHELVDYVLENDTEELCSRWDWLRDEEEEARLNFYYYAQRDFMEAKSNHATIQKEMEERGGVRRFRHGQFADQETQIVDLSRIRSDCLDVRLDRRKMALLKKSRALVLNIDYPLGFLAYYMMSEIARGAHDLRGAYIMGKSAAMIGRPGDIMVPSEIRDEHTRNRYRLNNCFSIRNLIGYLRDIAVFDDQRSVTVRGTFLHNRDFIKDLRRSDYTGIEMEAGPYLSALYEYIHGKTAPRESLVRVRPDSHLDIGILHYTSDTPYNMRASLLSSRLGYIGVEATYTCTLAIVQSIINKEERILRAE